MVLIILYCLFISIFFNQLHKDSFAVYFSLCHACKVLAVCSCCACSQCSAGLAAMIHPFIIICGWVSHSCLGASAWFQLRVCSSALSFFPEATEQVEHCGSHSQLCGWFHSPLSYFQVQPSSGQPPPIVLMLNFTTANFFSWFKYLTHIFYTKLPNS